MTEPHSTAATDPLPIRHEQTGHRGRFIIEKDGQLLAEMTYSSGDRVTIIDHTMVDQALRGTGAGRRLVEAAVQWARRDAIRLLPLCPFAKAQFGRTPEWADVLARP